jgi:glucose/arabinose dehydrogenase
MRRRIASSLLPVLATVLALLLSGASAASAADPPQASELAVLTGLKSASALAIAPDGRIFVGEQGTGIIRVVDPTTRVASVFYTVPRNRQLMGLGVHWAFPGTPYIYGYGTRVTTAGQTRLQLYRIRVSGNTGTGLTVLRDLGGIPSDHWGGHLAFGPGHRLYLSIGDGGVPADAQDPASYRGKILRMTDTGQISPNNPFGTLVWASGLRNPFGFTFDPGSSRIWATENGPECNDELNVITKGANYGWGATAACSATPTVGDTNHDGANPTPPKTTYSPTTAPTGIAFCHACGLGPDVEGALIYGTFVTGELHRVTLDPTRTGVVSEDVLLQHSGGIVGLERAPDGALWFIDRSGLYQVVPQAVLPQ